MKPRTLAPLAATVGLAIALVGCTAPGTGPTEGNKGGTPAVDGTLNLALGADPGAFNPLLTASTPAHQLASLTYDYLVFADPKSGEISPWLAESWTETTTTASFVIREGVTCADGTPLTAQTVADNVAFITNADNGSPLAGVYIPADATATADEASRTVTITTPAPSPFLLLSAARVPIMCEAGLTDPDAASKKSLGSGLFQVTEAVANDHYTLERRDDYEWGPGDTTSKTAGVPKKVVVSIVTNESTAANQLLSGDLNIAAIGGADQDRLSKLEFTERGSLTGEMFFNQIKGNVTADREVRKALMQALNVEDLAQVFTAGRGTVGTSMVGGSPRACTDDTVTGNLPTFDLDAAGATLDAAGWKLGSDGVRSKDGTPLKIRLVYETFGDSTDAAADLAQKAWTDLGASVELTSADQNKIVDLLLTGKDNSAWDIAWEPIHVNLPSMLVPFLSGPAPAAGLNFASIDNPDYNAGVEKASGLVGDEACAAWAEAETALITDLAVVPFATEITKTFFNKAALEYGTAATGPALRLFE